MRQNLNPQNLAHAGRNAPAGLNRPRLCFSIADTVTGAAYALAHYRLRYARLPAVFLQFRPGDFTEGHHRAVASGAIHVAFLHSGNVAYGTALLLML